MLYQVKYSVEGFPGERTAGPYTKEVAQSHRDDIAGYEGVSYAITIEIKEENGPETQKSNT